MRRRTADRGHLDVAAAAVAAAGFALLPFAFVGEARPGLSLAFAGRWPLLLPLLATIACGLMAVAGTATAGWRTAAAWLGLAALLLHGFLPELTGHARISFGLGAALLAAALVLQGARAAAAVGAFKADRWVSTATLSIVSLVLLFVFFPVVRVLVGAFQDKNGVFDLTVAVGRLGAPDIWGVACLYSDSGCGVVPNTIILGVLAGALSTLLGLAFALLAQRGGMKNTKIFDVMSILPIITPPFVIAMALVVLFGRTGVVTTAMSDWFGIPRSRWIYGLPGVLIAQVLSQTPLSYLMLRGALAAIAPSLEEAAQTLRASRWRTFRTVTWPLLRPAIAASFLLGFVESLADFGNPLVLGGSFDVLSTKIYFAVAGAQHDPGRAAVLALLLLALTLSAFWLQMKWLGKASYVTVTGKGDSGLAPPLPKGVRIASLAVVIPWVIMTLVLYGVILVGGFVTDIGAAHDLDDRAFPHGLRGRMDAARALVLGLRLGFLLRHRRRLGHRRAADGDHRHPHGLCARAP